MGKIILRYGLLVATFLLASRWLDYSLFAHVLTFEVYVGILALLFTCFGIWMGLKLTTPKNMTITRDADSFQMNQTALSESGISPREYEVLIKLAEGKSNQEIAESLFISLSTVKSHVSKIYEKLNVQRRTQAIQVAQRLGILP